VSTAAQDMHRNLALYPWFQFCKNLLFWQAIWFLYFQEQLSAAEAVLLYAIYDVSVTLFEVPSGYLSDRLGRVKTLCVCAASLALGSVVLSIGGSFALLALGQILYGLGMACVSGTDTALLYESLKARGQEAEVETQSLRAWRFGFAALALSAVIGGALGLYSLRLPFMLTACVFAVLLVITLRFTEPPTTSRSAEAQLTERARLRALGTALRQPMLLWLCALAVVMYGFSHLPFVFGQPFIDAALAITDYGAELSPLVSGVITTGMMGLSLAVSLAAPHLRARLGLIGLLLLAFLIQLFVPLVLVLSGSMLAILVLLLRMVPDSLSTAFQQAALQPLVPDAVRATVMSMQNLAGKLLFSATLWVAAASSSQVGAMPLPEIQLVLAWYVGAGALLWLGFAVIGRRLARDRVSSTT